MLQGDTIYCHPNVYKQVKKIVKEETTKESDFIYRPFGIKVIVDESLPEFVDGDGWQAEIKNDRFTEWYETDDNDVLLEEPASWMIYFGFVKKEQVAGMYLINTANITVFNPTGESPKYKRTIRCKDPFIPKQGLFE